MSTSNPKASTSASSHQYHLSNGSGSDQHSQQYQSHHSQNGHHTSTSTSTPHISPTASTSSSPAPSPSTSSTSFIRNGDIVYERGPPPAAPLPAVGARSYTVLKEVGDGSFGTVWLADWHSPLSLPKGTGPPGPSSRPEYKGKRLVALKRMKKAFEGGWDECMKLKELKSLRSIPLHPNIIPLYDAFLLPSSRELYFVFECMEGNLYQLTKSRKGRPLAAGLVADLFHQILLGLDHIHTSGYFHRDMKPENLLITTTGLADYPCYIAPHLANDTKYVSLKQANPEKDVVAIVKIADFGLARETRSKPPFTEYVSTRWYRAPEVLLRSRDYSNPVDMWAVGTILSEMVNLKPLFPGQSEVDQVYKICEVLGDPSSEYGMYEPHFRSSSSGQNNGSTRRIRGGGTWERGIKMAKHVGFSFPKIKPMDFSSLYDMNQVPHQLVEIMEDLMRYEPKARLTTIECLNHPYFSKVASRLKATLVPALPNHLLRAQAQAQAQQAQQAQIPPKVQVPQQTYTLPTPNSAVSREVPPSHSHTSQNGKVPFEPTSTPHHPGGLPLPHSSHYAHANGTGIPGSPAPSFHSQSEYYASASQARDRHSIAHSVMSESSALAGVQVHMGGSTTSNLSSPNMGYPESVSDVNMEDETSLSPRLPSIHQTQSQYLGGQYGQDQQQQQAQVQAPPSPVPSSVYSFGQGPSDSPSSSLPPPLPSSHYHHHLSQPSRQQHPLRQGANGYASSVYSGSYYNPSIYSGLGQGGRRGSAGGASTFYDGSIFEGIAPTRAASILSFPASYGEAPPSPKFSISQSQLQPQSHSQPPSLHHAPNPYVQGMRRQRNDPDNFSVDFEREALQRSQNAHVSNSGSTESLKAAASSSSNNATTTTSTKSGKRGWMSSILNSGSSSHQQPAYSHPQQQPLVVPPSFAAQQQQQQQAVINANAAAAAAAVVASSASIRSGTTSLKRSPSERSVEVPAAATSSPSIPLDPKKAKKEAERLAKEAEKAKREAAQRAARDRARAVMQKRQALAQAADPLHNVGQHQMPGIVSKAQQQAAQLQREQDKEKQRMLLEAAARKQQIILNSRMPQIQEDGGPRNPQYPAHTPYSSDMRFKARRRDDDDDVHSMSSSETRSERRFSISSHATASTVSTTNTFDSDPGASRPGRTIVTGGLLAPLRRSPSVASFGGQSHLSVGSQNSGHSYSSRRDLGTSGSNSSSLEFGLVGRFQGLTAAESDSRSASGAGSTSPTSAGGDSQHPSSPYYNHPTPHMPSHGQFAKHPGSAPGTGQHSHQQHSITLPGISSFDRPPPKEFSFPGSPAGSLPRTSQSQNSNNSTISGHSNFVSHNMYHQQQHHSHHS